MPSYRSFLVFAAPLAVLAIAGCGKSPTTDSKVVAEHRARLTLAEEPAGAQPVQAIRDAMYGVKAEKQSLEQADDHVDHDHAEPTEEHKESADRGDESAKGDVTPAENDHEDATESHEHEHEHGSETDPTAGKTPVFLEMDVVLTGVVGGLPNPSEQSNPEFPFSKGKAVIFVADPQAVAEMEEHAHHHEPGEECSFCAAHAGDSARSLAVVNFTDAAGKTIPVDARELFGLKENQHVVVRGTAKVDPSGLLTVAASGLYIRK